MSDAITRLNAALSGRYAVERQLGEGGMATVYQARDVKHDRSVALKVLKPELAAVVGAERFLAEIKTTANLQHPHILPLFDSGQADGMLYYVMPYVEGESLRERLDRERQLSVDEAVRIATNVAEALEYAHSRGVIHRDIKPANILIQAGKPVVSDFGIALAVSTGGSGRLTETGLSLGTPHYMSPEQATGDMQLGPATDVYALGCVLYEMLVGEPPYTGSTPQAILGKIIAGESASATKQRATVPANVDAAIRKALEKVPADRFASAGDFAKALADRGFRHGEWSAAGTPRGSTWRAAVLVGAGVLVGVAAAAAWFGAGPERAVRVGVMRFAVTTPASDSISTYPAGQDVAISADGTMIAYVGRTADGQAPRIYLRPIDQVEGAPLRGSENGFNPFFSPDGEWVGFVDATDSRTVKRVATTGGAAVMIGALSDPVLSIEGVTWVTEDEIIVGTGANTGLFRLRVGGGEPERLTEGSHHWPAMIEGRNALLLMDHTEGTHIATLDLRTGEVARVGLEGTNPRYVSTGHILYAGMDGSLRAVAFDAASLEVTGSPVALFDGLQVKAGEGAANFSVSDGGHLVYALGSAFEGRSNLVMVGRDGTRSELAEVDGIGWFPRFSPDGLRVAYGVSPGPAAGGTSDIWVLDVARAARTRVTFGGDNRYVPTWTRDGAWLTHADDTGATNRIVSTASDGGGRADTLLTVADRRFPTSWSPDGRTLAMYVGPQGTPTNSRDVWMLQMDGSRREPEPFVDTPFMDRAATFSTDGNWVAYVSDKSGQDEVYARPFPGPGPEVTISVGGGDEPVWAPSGAEIFYRRVGELIVAPVERRGSVLNVGSPRLVFADSYRRDAGAAAAVANYDVSPEGDRFVMVEEPNTLDVSVAALTRLRIVLNFFEELRERFPN